MKRELSLHNNIAFLHEQADGNSNKQIQQIKELLRKHIDLLIVSPNEVHPLSPIIQQVYDAGIPVIVVDRRTDSKKYTAFIGASNFEVGQNAGRYAALLLKGKGRIIEVTGLPDASPVIDRHNGFMDIIAHYPAITYVRKIDGDWGLKSFEKTVEDSLRAHRDIDLVFAQNDHMAFDVYKICKKLNLDHKIKIIGVDGLPWKDEGLDMVANKYIAATVLYPTGGQEAILTAVNILEHKPYKKENQLFTTIIDSSNVRIVKLQNEKVQAQQEDIDRRQGIIKQQEIITRNKTTVIYIISISLALALIFGAILFYYFRENKKINAILAHKNEEILNQQTQLIEMYAKAQKANEAKVNFFTNISHEFRTPLTLILGTLEDLASDTKLKPYIRQSHNLIQKNVIRLLRLFNQLMDFRKIEVDKMKLRASQNDLVSFVSEILQAYKSVATNRNIDLRLITNERHLDVWFDTSMMDKVIFNLLSNAFKFTKDNGNIHVYITKNEQLNLAIIKVEDNGVGMTKDAVEHAFDIFYQGEYENYKGIGLGLALSKELIQLHKGQISVQSEKWRGTTFEIQLPLGNAHLQKEEMIDRENEPSVTYEHEKFYTEEIVSHPIPENEEQRIIKEKEYTILIVEDNADLREFLVRKLSTEYEVFQAENGQMALQLAFDIIPDLIICDVVIPGKDGIALTNIIKSDIRTSHIPIILLTAKTAVEQQIEGMKNKADVYMTKPFNAGFLKETIQSLIANRIKLKEHFTGELSFNLKTKTSNKLDRKFINEFSSIVESNISNENFSIEEICKIMGISKVHLYKKVKSLLNINVNEYILNARLQKAKYLIQHEELTISEIAYKVGFSTPAYFSTVFKSKFGITPKSFKDKM